MHRPVDKEKMTEYMGLGRVTDPEDPTILNYMALLCAIFNKGKFYGMFYDYKESQRRMAELDEIYARGELPPLAIEFKKSAVVDRTKQEYIECFGSAINGKKVRVIDLKNQTITIFKSKKEAAKYIAKVSDTELSNRTVEARLTSLKDVDQVKVFDFIVENWEE